MKLILLRGLPASGKSTQAKKIIEGGGEFFRVNRDLLRTMLHCDKWTGKREGTTVDTAQIVVGNLLMKGKNVIVDDTNLGQKHLDMWKEVAKNFEAKFEVINMMEETTVAECIQRDADRIDKPSVGKDVIMNMAIQYGLVDLDKIVVVDIDGTVADCSHRQHHVRGDMKDWKSFFATMDKDTPRTDVYESAFKGAEVVGAKLLFVTARPEEYREVTEKWLKKHGMGHYHLIMRRSGDKRPDTEVKFDIYRQYLKQYDIVKVYDDRPAVIRMWKEQGLSVEDVGNGEEF